VTCHDAIALPVDCNDTLRSHVAARLPRHQGCPHSLRQLIGLENTLYRPNQFPSRVWDSRRPPHRPWTGEYQTLGQTTHPPVHPR
jgi:hypothetical protein